MNLNTSSRHLSRNILIRMAILALAMIVLVAWQRELVIEIYFKNQITGHRMGN